MRWQAPDGTVWDSKFEYEVFLGLSGRTGYRVRKTAESDSVCYTRPIRNGACTRCPSREVVSEHTYTPDLHIVQEDSSKRGAVGEAESYYVEAKGYLRADRRSLLRALCKARPDLHLRLLVQRDYRVSARLTITEWARKFLKIPVAIWPGDGSAPNWS